jgi:hypothetical protein
MPTYLYLCEAEENSHGEFEEYHSVNTKLEKCPLCEKEGKDTSVKRLICGTTRGVVELTGQDLVDSVKADVKRIKKEAAADANKYANLIGEKRYNDIQTRMDRQKR